MRIQIPYGDESMGFDAPDSRVKAVLRPNEGNTGEAGPGADAKIIRNALANPIGSSPLYKLAKGKQKVTIITSDHTRPMPSRVTLPLLLEEIRKGSPEARILILVATGMHRAMTEEEQRARFGDEIFFNEEIIVHDSRDENVLKHIGSLPSGGALVLSRHALDADLLVAEGFIEPHFFAGFSGGRKSVLPGVASYECVVSNHCSAFIADKNAAAGLLDGNPIHLDMEYAAEKAGLAFILNVMLGEGRKISDAVAGDPVLAHTEGCARLMKRVAVKRVTAPIVITSNGGYPLDQNLYQMVKSMYTADKCCEGGVVIAVGECRDGTGSEAFYNDFAGGASPETLTEQFMSRKQCETPPDQWQSQILARILERRRVIVVAPLVKEYAENMGFSWANDIESALEMADGMLGRPEGEEAEIVVIPDGPGVIVSEGCKAL